MALHWSLEEIKDYKTTCWIETGETHEDGTPVTRLNPLTETLIFMTIAVKLGRITEKNADEFYARTKIIEKLDGPFLYKFGEDGKEDRFITTEEIRAHVGLGTNVTDESTAAFFGGLRRHTFTALKKLYRADERKALATATKEKEAA